MPETPPLRVSRPIAACAPCRRTKSKCDGKLPVCSSCEKSGKADQCASNSSDTRETSYVATLESKKAALEKAYAEARARRQSLIGVVESASVVPSSRRTSIAEPQTSRKRKDGKEANNVDDLVGDFGLMSISATSRDFCGFTPETSYARFVLYSAAKHSLPASGISELQLPPRDDAIRMIQQCLTHNLKYLPILDEPSIWSAFNRVYTDSLVTPLDRYLVNIVLAIQLEQQDKRNRQSPKSPDTAGQSVAYLAKAIAETAEVLQPGSVTSIQALMLLAVHAYIDPTYFDSWSLIGFASRAMVDIGMHHDPPKSGNTQKSELDQRKRVFWCVYSLDRLASMASRRPFSFSDDSTGVTMPSAAHCSPSALALFKLRQMQSEFYTALFQPSSAPSYDGSDDPWAYVWRMYSKLGDWLQQTRGQADAASASVMELEYSASCMLLLGPSPRCPSPDAHASTVRQQVASTFIMLARENHELFYLQTLEAMAGQTG